MAKYILKQEAIFALTNEAKTHNNPVKRAYTRAAALIEQITAEDVQPVRHGRWELTDNPNFRKCSECGAWWSRGIADNCFTNYCPNCGAKMIKDGDTNG